MISSTKKLHIIIECDEKQHIGESYNCEVGRMSEILDEIKEGKVIFIRWNPDAFVINGKRGKCERKERLKVLDSLINKIINGTILNEEMYHVYYLFYSKDNPNIVREYPMTFLYNKI